MEVVWDREERGLLLGWSTSYMGDGKEEEEEEEGKEEEEVQEVEEDGENPPALCPECPPRAHPPAQSCPPPSSLTAPSTALSPERAAPGLHQLETSPEQNEAYVTEHWLLLGPSQQGGRSNPFSLPGSWHERWGGGHAGAGNRTGTADEVGLKPAEPRPRS